jgi:hypothetical protein
MRIFKRLSFCGVLGVCSLLVFGFQETDETKPGASIERKGLVRMELLDFPQKEPVRSHRNIFTQKTGSAGRRQPGDAQEKTERDPGDETLRGEENPVPALSIRYIGYVKSGHKVTALIVFQGDAFAVEEGETIAVGLQIKTISMEEIGVLGPDGQIRTFPIEGDRP